VSADDFFRRVITALDRANVPYMVTGSFASSAHGRARASYDIDIVIAPTDEQLRALIREFPADRYYADEEDAFESKKWVSQFNVIDFSSTWKVDLIFRKDREFSRAEFDRRRLHTIEGMRVYVATPEDVLISKLEWAKMGESDRQIEDVVGIIRIQGSQLDIAYIERWVRELALETQWQKALARSTV